MHEIVDGPKPKHAQLREILRRLAEQDLAPGSPIPSERDLAERYGVSRITVRAAVGQLVAEGLLTRAKGRGRSPHNGGSSCRPICSRSPPTCGLVA